MTTIASRAKTCVDLFAECAELLRQPDYQSDGGISENQVVDALGRYRIWAGNIGALQQAETKSSLDFRLREAPKIATQINEILEELKESLEDAASIFSNARGNRTGVVPVVPGVSIGSDDEEEISEIQEIFDSVNDAINNLFRFSILLRNNTNRDRYAKAMAAGSSPFNDQFDICHVDHKFPTLRLAGKEWLVKRLGKAITQRRQFLRYAREHRDKTSRDRDSEPMVVPQQMLSPVPIMPIEHHLSPRSDFSKPPSTLAHTQASTLVLMAGEIIEEELVDDTQSQTSYATSMDEGSGGAKLHVIPVEDVSKGLAHFECIYCWQIQRLHSQKAWKKHVLADLKPYVCTFQECELKLFSDRHAWFSHELKDHRREFQCLFCPHLPFKNAANYQHHLVNFHQLPTTKEQLPAILEMSQRAVTKVSPTECPFCEDWEECLRAVNTHIPHSESLIITPSQFQHHVGAHMEQLALFAIPRGYIEKGDADSGSAAAPRGNSDSVDSSIGDTSGLTSADIEDLIHCQQVLEDLLSEGYVSEHFKHQPSFPTFSMWLPTRDFVRVVPLDLNTISQKLASGNYPTARDFQLDVVLMFAMHRIVRTNETDFYNDSKVGDLFNTRWHVKLSAKQFSVIVRQTENKMRWVFFNARNLLSKLSDDRNTQTINFITKSGDQWDVMLPKKYGVPVLYAYVECRELLADLGSVPIVGDPGTYPNPYYFILTMDLSSSPRETLDINTDLVVGDMFGGSASTKIYIEHLGDTELPVQMIGAHHETPINPQISFPLSEPDALKLLTSWKVFIISPDSKATWAMCEVREERRSQSEISRIVKGLDESKRAVHEKKAALMPYQTGHINRVMDDLIFNEKDPNFEWTLVQLEIFEGSRPARYGEISNKETLAITMYTKRAPLPDKDPVALYHQIKRMEIGHGEEEREHERLIMMGAIQSHPPPLPPQPQQQPTEESQNEHHPTDPREAAESTISNLGILKPSIYVSHLPSTSNLYSFLIKPLGIDYLPATKSPPTSLKYGYVSRSGAESKEIVLFSLVQSLTPRLKHITFSAPNKEAVRNFHAMSLVLKNDSQQGGNFLEEDEDEDIVRAVTADYDGNIMEVVNSPHAGSQYPALLRCDAIDEEAGIGKGKGKELEVMPTGDRPGFVEAGEVLIAPESPGEFEGTAAKLAQRCVQLYRFWESLQEAPVAIAVIKNDLLLLSEVLQDIANKDLSPALSSTLDACQAKLEKLEKIIRELETDSAVASLKHEHLGVKFQIATKVKQVERFRQGLSEVRNTLMLGLMYENIQKPRLSFTNQDIQNIQVLAQETTDIKSQLRKPVLTKDSPDNNILPPYRDEPPPHAQLAEDTNQQLVWETREKGSDSSGKLLLGQEGSKPEIALDGPNTQSLAGDAGSTGLTSSASSSIVAGFDDKLEVASDSKMARTADWILDSEAKRVVGVSSTIPINSGTASAANDAKAPDNSGQLSSDITNAVTFCRTLCRRCREAGGDYDEVSREVRALYTVLKHLGYEVAAPESPLNHDQSLWDHQLAPIISGCHFTLRQLDELLKSNNAGRSSLTGLRGLLGLVKFGSNKNDTLAEIRVMLLSHKNSLTLFLDTIQLQHSE